MAILQLWLTQAVQLLQHHTVLGFLGHTVAQHHDITATLTAAAINKQSQGNSLGPRPSALKQSAPVPVKPLAFQNILASGLLGMIPEPWQCGKTSYWPMVKHIQERQGRALHKPFQTDAIKPV